MTILLMKFSLICVIIQYILLNTVTHRSCSQCSSNLIFVSKVTEQIEGNRFPQTTTLYRCSNKVCQDNKDKEAAKRMKLMKDKEKSDKKRVKEKLAQKKLLLKLS